MTWLYGDLDLVEETLRKKEALRDVKTLSDGWSKAKLFHITIIAPFQLSPETLAPYMRTIVEKVGSIDNQFSVDPADNYEIEVGLYSLDDVRAWRVWRT